MSISFACPRCGKKLKAPDNAGGKSSKCPGCGAQVTCPEPIYNAEVVEMTAVEPRRSDPYGMVNDDQPYAVVEPESAVQVPTESRRPCPMCGEMIVAAAAKCRFCGEIFDPALKKTKKRRPGDSRLTGGDIALALICSGIGCICGVVWIIQGKPKGLKMFGIAILADIVKSILWAIFRVSQEGAVGP
jgi:predicted RNA-binding Zn-ribbon protein involved in translation (DUF1610 family)